MDRKNEREVEVGVVASVAPIPRCSRERPGALSKLESAGEGRSPVLTLKTHGIPARLRGIKHRAVLFFQGEMDRDSVADGRDAGAAVGGKQCGRG